MRSRTLSLTLALLAACGSPAPPGTAADGPGPPITPPAATTAPPPADTPPEPLPAPPSGLSMGANVTDGATDFRVWAPAATAARVEGDFPGSPAAMAREDGGRFFVRAPGARAGHRYRYVLETAGKELTRLDPYGRQIDGDRNVVVDPLAYRWKTKPLGRAAREGLVVYEMHIGSFAPPAGSTVGTFESAIARLDALADLGVNVIELMPVHAFGGNPNGWGYNPHSYFAPKPSYGTADELRHFIDEAHARGIRVWLDVVYNHVDGWKSMPLRCFDGHCPKGEAGVFFFGDPTYASTPWGPRPAFDKKEVRDFLLDSVHAWLVEMRGDGFRFDSTSNVRALDGKGDVPGGRDFLRAANDWSHQLGAISTAEDLKGEPSLTRPTGDGGLGFDAQWDGFGWSVTETLEGADDDARTLDKIVWALTSSYDGDPLRRVLFTETHDTVGNGGVRFNQKVDAADPSSWAARKRSTLAAALLFTAPGVPMLFQGQEMLSVGTFSDPPAPLDWSRAQSHAKIRALYKRLIALRKNVDGTTGGLLGKHIKLVQRHDQNKVVAFRRWSAPGDDVIVLVNMRNKAYTRYDVGAPTGGTWKVRVDTDARAWSDDFGDATSGDVVAVAAQKDGEPFSLPVPLGPYSAVVLSR